MGQDAVTIEVDAVLHETDDAVLVEIDGEQIWLPLSQVDGVVRGRNPAITAKRWILEKKGLI